VDGLRQHLLPGSGLTKQQDCRVGLRDLRDFLKHAQKTRRLAHDSLRRSELCGVLQIGILSLKPVLQNLYLRHRLEQLFLLALSRDGMSEYFTHERQPCNQIVRPGAGIAKGCESNGADDAPADAKRDAQMRMHSRPSEIFRLANRFGWKIIGRVLYREHLAGTKSGNEPVKLRRKGT
jgi:hypothetical protein